MVERRIVAGQRVAEAKKERSRQFRREMTHEERLLWTCLRNGRLLGLRFHRHQVIDGFIADFYCASAGVVIEVDGASHDCRKEYDKERDRVLAAHDLMVVRVSNDQVNHDLRLVLDRIREVCERVS